MRKAKRQYLNWKRKQNEKNLLIRTERKRIAKIRKHKKLKRSISLRREKNDNKITYQKEFVAPSSFSFVYNPEETIEYFNKIIEFITNKENYQCSLFFDVSKIKVLTIDALMYLLSIINNLRTKYRNKYFFSGNEPDEPSLKKTFKESGFYSFVNYKGNDSLQRNKDNIQIAFGKKCENDVAKNMSDFVVDKFGVEKRNLGFLYDVMIEMMSNTYRHAYNEKKSILEPVWYCFAEYDRNDTILFSFMDTGSGIPSTVKKNFFETIDF